MRQALIESYVNQLRNSFGPVRPLVAEEKLQSMYDVRNYAGMVVYIRDVLCLNMKVYLGLVNSGGPTKAPAWIDVPPDLPFYHSPEFKQTVVRLHLRKSFLKESTFDEVVLAIAHELCHIVLYATRHQLQYEEEAVDLIAMILGFRDFYVTGCQSVIERSNHCEIRHVGYLSLEEVNYAARYMTFR